MWRKKLQDDDRKMLFLVTLVLCFIDLGLWSPVFLVKEFAPPFLTKDKKRLHLI